MNHLMTFIPYILISIPVISTIIIYQIRFKMIHNQWASFHLAAQLSAIFYIAAVSTLLHILFDSYYIGIILIILISVLALIIIIQWKKDTEVLLLKGLKLLSRISFLTFFIGYIVLLILWGIDNFI